VKIAFVHDWNVNYEQELSWQDGLAAALKELQNRGHTVTAFVSGTHDEVIPNPLLDIIATPAIPEWVAAEGPDVILCWADMTRPNAKPLKALGIPMAICFAGGEPINYNTYDFDHVFVESKVYEEAFKKGDVSVSLAFGTNTDLFVPIEQVKIFDTIFPATFAAWKRHDLYALATRGLKSLACGYIYTDHEQECWEECIRMGTTILPHVSADVLHYLYAASRICVITSQSNGGSQRTVLEAMAMNLPLIVTDSDKYDYITPEVYRCEPDAEEIRGYINAILDGDGDINTRDFVLENYSHIQYADKLEAELGKII
jgi:hypothetical protein